MTVKQWNGCYDEHWREMIVPGAFSHPAKMSRGLIRRIFDELLASGRLKPGDTVLDPFGGIGTTALEGAMRAVQVICCELEPKFVELARQNIELHRRNFQHFGWPIPVIVQGDSRKLRLHIAGASAVVASPPYSEGLGHGGGKSEIPHDTGGTAEAMMAGYGDAPGQMGEMPEGSIDTVLASPPYVNREVALDGRRDEQLTRLAKAVEQGRVTGRESVRVVRRGVNPNAQVNNDIGQYGETEGQMGRMGEGSIDTVLGSPPYAGNDDRDNTKQERDQLEQGSGSFRGTYGRADGQMAALPSGSIAAVVSSPPYEEIATGAGGLNTKPAKDGQQGGRNPAAPSQQTDQKYGNAEGQLAKLPKGDVDAIVSSPPFTQGYSGGGGINKRGYNPAGGEGADKVGDRTYQGTGAERAPGNLETMPFDTVDSVVGSPPWGDEATGGVTADKFKQPEDFLKAGRGKGASDEGRLRQLERDKDKVYGDSNGQMGRMAADAGVDGVLGSPPYEGSLAQSPNGGDGIDWEKARREGPGGGEHQKKGASGAAAYEPNPANIGNRTGETFWSAALEVVKECYAVLKPGGTAVWVVKAFVRDKRIVDFPGDWRRLCEHVGFETDLEVHAMLVAEEIRPHLFDGEVVHRTERKSFFRRLAEKKGSPRIDWETVYFMRKPL